MSTTVSELKRRGKRVPGFLSFEEFRTTSESDNYAEIYFTQYLTGRLHQYAFRSRSVDVRFWERLKTNDLFCVILTLTVIAELSYSFHPTEVKGISFSKSFNAFQRYAVFGFNPMKVEMDRSGNTFAVTFPLFRSSYSFKIRRSDDGICLFKKQRVLFSPLLLKEGRYLKGDLETVAMISQGLIEGYQGDLLNCCRHLMIGYILNHWLALKHLIYDLYYRHFYIRPWETLDFLVVRLNLFTNTMHLTNPANNQRARSRNRRFLKKENLEVFLVESITTAILPALILSTYGNPSSQQPFFQQFYGLQFLKVLYRIVVPISCILALIVKQLELGYARREYVNVFVGAVITLVHPTYYMLYYFFLYSTTALLDLYCPRILRNTFRVLVIMSISLPALSMERDSIEVNVIDNDMIDNDRISCRDRLRLT